MKGVWQKQEEKFRFVASEFPTLAPDYYSVSRDYQGPLLEQQNTHFDENHLIEDPTTKNLIETTINFFLSKEKYDEIGAVHKRGILLYGPPGTGKSSILNMLSDVILKKNGVIILTKQKNIMDVETLIHQVRNSSEDQPIGVIMEDIENYIHDSHTLKFLLNLLSGQSQINGVLFMATTNLPIEKIPKTLSKRPSRFDVVQFVGFPEEAIRLQFLQKFAKGNVPKPVLEEIASKTDGLSLAHLKEIVISHYCLNENLQDSIDRLKPMEMDSVEPTTSEEEDDDF